MVSHELPSVVSLRTQLTRTNRTCPEVQPWLYGYDAIQEVEDAVKRNPEVFSQEQGQEQGQEQKEQGDILTRLLRSVGCAFGRLGIW